MTRLPRGEANRVPILYYTVPRTNGRPPACCATLSANLLEGPAIPPSSVQYGQHTVTVFGSKWICLNRSDVRNTEHLAPLPAAYD